MARAFVKASSQYASRNQAVVTALPCTFACWFRTTNNTDGQVLMGIGATADAVNFITLQLNGNYAGDPILAYIRGQNDGGAARSTSGYSLNTWHHACGVFVNNYERHAYIDGGSKGSDTDSQGTCVGLNTTAVAVCVRSDMYNYCDAEIAEAAIWDAALTDEEVAALGKGFSPLFIRPQNLKAYWPLIRKGPSIDNIDLVGGYHLTDYNSPTDAAHCRIIRPAPRLIGTPTQAASPIPVFQRHYRNMRVA